MRLLMTSELLKHQGLAEKPDVIAPDGSEIRLLPALQDDVASVVHCTLPPAQTSLTISHQTVEEVWHLISGTGQVWRAFDGFESIAAVGADDSLNIPLGTKFQFRNSGPDDLEFIIVTSPPWPGEGEAKREPDYWQTV